MQVGMDSYFYAGRFYPHGAAPPSPELPFCFDSALPLVVEPPGATELPNDGAFRGYGEVAGQEVIAAGAGQGSAVMNAPGMMRADREQSRRREEEGSQRRQPGVVESSRGFRSYGEVPGQEVIAAGAGQGSVGMNGPGMMRAGPEQSRSREEEGSERRQSGAVESSRGFRHMMRERQRREKLSQSYADLYAMVAARSKGDKNSIVQSAAIYIHELNGARERLQRRNEELKARILGHDERQPTVKVDFEVDDPASGVDSMIGALRRLKTMGVKARGIRSTMSGARLWTQMNIETTIAASEVEKAVEEALMKEVERKQAAQA